MHSAATVTCRGAASANGARLSQMPSSVELRDSSGRRPCCRSCEQGHLVDRAAHAARRACTTVGASRCPRCCGYRCGVTSAVVTTSQRPELVRRVGHELALAIGADARRSEIVAPRQRRAWPGTAPTVSRRVVSRKADLIPSRHGVDRPHRARDLSQPQIAAARAPTARRSPAIGGGLSGDRAASGRDDDGAPRHEGQPALQQARRSVSVVTILVWSSLRVGYCRLRLGCSTAPSCRPSGS